MATATRPAAAIKFPTSTFSTESSPDEIEMLVDSRMVESAAAMDRDKCLRIGCITMIDPQQNPTGICRFHDTSRK